MNRTAACGADVAFCAQYMHIATRYPPTHRQNPPTVTPIYIFFFSSLFFSSLLAFRFPILGLTSRSWSLSPVNWIHLFVISTSFFSSFAPVKSFMFLSSSKLFLSTVYLEHTSWAGSKQPFKSPFQASFPAKSITWLWYEQKSL